MARVERGEQWPRDEEAKYVAALPARRRVYGAR